MSLNALTGSRIRERRIELGLKQRELAQRAGISPAYLNLIEHNRRRIGGKLLSGIAGVLNMDPASLADGAEAGVVTALHDAAARFPEVSAELQRTEEFAGRFPGWTALLVAQRQRIRALERSVEGLTDRMAHDPHLAASLHDLLSTVTAISSTANILVETREIEEEWRDRFHRNIHEDSQRLAENSQALVAYMDSIDQTDAGAGTPQEELELWLRSRDFHIAELERALPAEADRLVQNAEQIATTAGQTLAISYIERYLAGARQMPLAEFEDAAHSAQFDPGVLANRFGTDVASVLHRIATLPTPEGSGEIGMVACDGAGALSFRKPIPGFPLPRFGAPCPLWPLFQALSRPMTPVRALIEMPGQVPTRFLTYAVSQVTGPAGFDAPSVFEATMLILPADRVTLPDLPVQRMGTNCRICAQEGCVARRESSVLSEVVSAVQSSTV